jgi:nucleoside phosphorylase
MVMGRSGHARVAVLSIIPEELQAVQDAFQAYTEIEKTALYVPADVVHSPGFSLERPVVPLLVALSPDRSNAPAMGAVADLLEDWSPEYVIVSGIAGGILRPGGPEDKRELKGLRPGDVIAASYIHYAEYGKKEVDKHALRYSSLMHPQDRLVNQHVQPLVRAWADDPVHRHRLDAQGTPPGVGKLVAGGEIVAVESVAADYLDPHQQFIVNHFDNSKAVDMESWGVARAMVSHSRSVHYNPRWMCIRGISDSVLGCQEGFDLLQAELGVDSFDNNAQRADWKDVAARAAARVARLVAERLLDKDRPEHPPQNGAPRWPDVVGTEMSDRGTKVTQ